MEDTMTVREVAEAMGVSRDTVKNCIRRIMPNKMENGKTTLLSEEEVASISREIKGNSQVMSQLTYEAGSQVSQTFTPLEVLQDITLALSRAQGMILQLQRENERLAIREQEHKDWYTIKRMEILNPGREFSWRLLRRAALELSPEDDLRKDVPDANYDKVKAYHISVWYRAYGDTLNVED